MSNHEQPTPSHPKSDVRNTVGKDKQTHQGSARTKSAVDLEEFCEKHYEKLLPIMADKYEYEKIKKEKLEEVKAQLDFGGTQKKSTRAQELAYSESRTMSPRRHKRSHSPRQSSSVFTRLKRERSSRHESSRYTENHSESEDSEGGHWRPKSRKQKPSIEDDDLSQPWKKCIRDPIMLHNIKQRDGESTKDFIQRYKSESGNVKGAPECMRISGFVHGITNPELIKRFHEKIPKTVDEMMQVATSFLQGQEAASNQERKKAPSAWKHQEGGHRQNFKKGGGFRSQHKQEKRPDRFTLLTKTPKEILVLEKGKFKTPPPMTTPVEKQNANKELKQSSGKDQQKKKGETSGKEKPQAILIIQSRQKVIRQKITQSSSPNPEISFPSLRDDEGAEGPLIIEAEIGGHQVHQMDNEHSTSAWLDFIVVRSTSPHNGIIGRPGLRKIQAVPSTTYGMIKFLVIGGILTLRSNKIIPIECAMVSGPEDQPLPVNKVKEERVKVAINPEHPEQIVMIDSNLTEKARVRLCNLLQRSLDVFAWTPTNMTGVPRHIAEHRLNVREGCQPIRQKKRGQAAERNIAINDEVSKLVAAGIMREVHYHDWLSNPVMVKKNDNSWRMCVDFKDLNKACPKDGYPLPEID
ncbi:hypothetical protein Tco_0088689 [Tanacetum coccineum]